MCTIRSSRPARAALASVAMDKVFTSLAVLRRRLHHRDAIPVPDTDSVTAASSSAGTATADTPSQLFPGFPAVSSRAAPSSMDLAGRVGAVVAGRNTYDDSDGFAGRARTRRLPLIVVSHHPAPPEATDKQTFVTSIEAGIESARAAAGDRDIAVMGGGVVHGCVCAPDCSTR